MNRTYGVFILSVLALCSWPALASGPILAHFPSANKQVAYELFGEASHGPLLVMLHGASGPGVPLYRDQAQYFAEHDYTVFFLHYFDAARSSMPTDNNYAAWELAVRDLVAECRKNPAWEHRKIALMGFSLGASVALAAGSQRVPVDAIAEWYGSLPDAFFAQRKGMPPLLILHGNSDGNIPVVNAQQLAQLCAMEHYNCESHIYPGQGHGFDDSTRIDADKRTLDFFSRKLK